MLWNIKIAFRNLLKSKLATFINVVGISLGLTTSLLLLSYVKNELNTDTYLNNYERIYRVQRGETGIWLSNSVVEVIKEKVPQIEHITCYHQSFSSQNIVSYNRNNYVLGNVILADADFFKVFNYKIIFGNPLTCLAQPNSLVICQSEAKNIFGNRNPVGEPVQFTTTGQRGGEFNFVVTAVIEDPPKNSSINFKNILSQAFTNNNQVSYQSNRNWDSNNFITHALLKPNTDVEKVTENIRSSIKNAVPENRHEHIEQYRLNPLKGIYFDNVPYWAVTQNTGKKSVVFFLGIIGVLILLIAGINYFNLMMANSKKRLKAIATNKIVGASQINVLSQSFFESVIVIIFASLISILLGKLTLPFFNSLIDKPLSFNAIFSSQNALIIYLILFIPILLFGVLPVIILSKQNIVDTLKGEIAKKRTKLDLKNGLIVFQFIITIGLTISVLIVQKQNRFLMNSDYGMARDQIYCIQLNPSIHDKSEVIAQEIKRNPHVENIAYGFDHFGDFAQGGSAKIMEGNESRDINFSEYSVYGDFVDLFNLKLLEGRDFNQNAMEERNIIVNKTFLEQSGISDPVYSHTKLFYAREYYNIIGVVDDFHFKSKYFRIEPIIFMYNRQQSNVMYVKLNTASVNETKTIINGFKDLWEKNVAVFPFEGEFLSDHYESLYQSEVRFMRIIMTFSVLSIILGCLGLFGITVSMNQQRIKEIGVRKVNGAKISEVMLLLNQGYLKWIFIAFVIASPIAYYAMTKWLQNFAYKTELSWWIFALAGLLALGIALLTVSWQSWRAATRNPVEALRYE